MKNRIKSNKTYLTERKREKISVNEKVEYTDDETKGLHISSGLIRTNDW